MGRMEEREEWEEWEMAQKTIRNSHYKAPLPHYKAKEASS